MACRARPVALPLSEEEAHVARQLVMADVESSARRRATSQQACEGKRKICLLGNIGVHDLASPLRSSAP
ncbi:uncharacterized protein ColSpa_12149 [Colletotrichum spaethianum]|uniref:Uncharacterized protein n=1 Tax=Colletotrichum spaethianum TaxID=700344 RepID=A0AA37PGN7_9PEZI|nr:uncharacterized protein ColSpa_12149 [Colletotrichum spaethianum]GKT51968.1 hypothetical protein ColSpa_12149 [Colletotrichum spaethianum]